MRTLQLLFLGVLSLLLAGCSGNSGAGTASLAPPPLNKDLLAGKWKNALSNPAVQFFVGYEFAGDGTLKEIFAGLKEPVPAKYVWSGERTIDVEYQATPEVRQAYSAAVKTFKERYRKRVKEEGVSDKALSSLDLIPEDLPAKDSYRVAISEAPQMLLFLTDEKGTQRTFEKAN
jgi:hypothetical protein